MRRREFLGVLGGAAAWPMTARAQQSERMRHVGVLMNLAADDPDAQARLANFRQGLEQLGWIEGRNIQLNIQYGNSRPSSYPTLAKQLVATKPEVIIAHSISHRRRIRSGNSYDSGCVCQCFRPHWLRLHKEHGATKRQRHWSNAV
jgi:hypothetical protein